MTTQSHHDAIKNKVLTGNNALRVHMYLKANETDRPYRLPRWIWELLQNARDASTVFDIQLETEIKYSQEELIFLHNGTRFSEEQIAHLIFHGSTKIEDEETIGQYGSGFLTTHLLSPVIKVSGQLDDGRYFNFCLQRKPDSPDAVRESMDQAWDDYTHSLSDEKPPIPKPFTTQFVYPIINEDAQEAVDAGLKTLGQCAPFVVAFNQNFLRIHIERSGKAQSFEVDKRTPLDHDGFYEIVVVENRDGSCRKGKYLLAEGDQGAVTVPLESNGERSICLSVENTPRLFKEFPLVWTESFSFPAVINSLKFATKEERDGIRLGLNDADPGNIENQSVIEEACALLVRLLGYAASSGWHHTHRWAKIPTIQDEKWVDEKWLKECIRSKFLADISDTPVVLNKTNNAMLTTESKLPMTETCEDVNALFGLLESWTEYSEKLPRQQEAIGWCETIRSWTNVLEIEALTFKHEVEALTSYGAIDGRGLALHLEEKTKNSHGWGRIEILQTLLQPHVCEIQWIDEFCRFLRDNGFDNVMREHRIVPDQEGFFDELPNLKRDLGIDKDLMEIDELLNLRSKGLLRDTRITSLAEERGDGDADNEFILGKLIKELQERSENNPDNNFKKASAQLFAWIVHQDQNNWNLLRDVPVFTEDGNTHYSLSSASPTNTVPLAPIRAWPEDLQQFSDLFPPSRILDDAFFGALPDTNTWQMLDEEAQLIRQNMIVHYNSKNLNQFSSDIYMDDDDTGKHEAMNSFPATAIVAWPDIMDRVTDSSGRGRLFWKFLTEWLIKKDVSVLETKEARCALCGQDITHRYYPAAWLEAVRKNKWIRQGNRVPADEKSLANLLKDSEDIQSSLDGNPAVVKLLKAIDLNFSVLKLELIVAGNEEKRNKVLDVATTVYRRPRLTQYIQENENLTQDLEELLDENQGDVSQLKLVSQDFKDDKKLPKLLEDRRKHRQKWRDNQDLGAEVEKLVKGNLEQVGFSVKRTGTGSDFEISEDTDDITQLEIEGGVQSWLVEVKSTKTENDYQYVRMTSTQAENAVKEKEGFLLCVVPLGEENPTPENVKKNMRFIQNIGDPLTQICENLNSLEDLRDEITTDDISGVQLIIEAGKAGILIQKSVWESDQAFPLEKLAERLK